MHLVSDFSGPVAGLLSTLKKLLAVLDLHFQESTISSCLAHILRLLLPRPSMLQDAVITIENMVTNFANDMAQESQMHKRNPQF